MTSRFEGGWRLAAGLAFAAAISGCGLKGALALPEKSGNVVVREHSATTSSGTTASSGTPSAVPDAPPLPEKLPPPELPRSNNGTSR